MDLSAMMTKIDLHKYTTVQQFQHDIELICCNALEYNPDRDPQGLYQYLILLITVILKILYVALTWQS